MSRWPYSSPQSPWYCQKWSWERRPALVGPPRSLLLQLASMYAANLAGSRINGNNVHHLFCCASTPSRPVSSAVKGLPTLFFSRWQYDSVVASSIASLGWKCSACCVYFSDLWAPCRNAAIQILDSNVQQQDWNSISSHITETYWMCVYREELQTLGSPRNKSQAKHMMYFCIWHPSWWRHTLTPPQLRTLRRKKCQVSGCFFQSILPNNPAGMKKPVCSGYGMEAAYLLSEQPKRFRPPAQVQSFVDLSGLCRIEWDRSAPAISTVSLVGRSFSWVLTVGCSFARYMHQSFSEKVVTGLRF